MGKHIPHAGGLERELDQRVPGRWIASDPDVKTEDEHTVTARVILVDSKPIGTLIIRTYHPQGHKDVERVKLVNYDGVMPGYENPGNIGTISMRASEVALGRGISPDDGKKRNDTLKLPLYRHDYHPLGLTDNEVLAGKEEEYAEALRASSRQRIRRR